MKFVDYKEVLKPEKTYYILTVVYKPKKENWQIRTYFLSKPMTGCSPSPLCYVEVTYDNDKKAYTAHIPC